MMRVPESTYRLQFMPSYGFRKHLEIVSYLSDLGFSDVYASPIFKAKTGSTHGYDVTNPNQINPELGTPEDFAQLVKKVKELNMGWLQDIVPNHMAYDGENEMLMDVLENGKSSPYYTYFDIDWGHPYLSIRGRLLAPFLGKFYAECLRDGEIKMGYDQQGLCVRYYELKFPLKIESYAKVLLQEIKMLEESLGENNPVFIKFVGTIHLFKAPSHTSELQKRYSNIKYAKKMLWELYTSNEKIKKYIDYTIRTFNGKKGDFDSLELLDKLLSEQYYRLSFWKVANEEINYRRFFSINGLISLRVEDQEVFENTHALIFKLIKDGTFTGLRVDHIDGLYDPTAYVQKLKKKCDNTFVVVEKILDFDEALPSFWPIQGTSGYEFMNMVNELFCYHKNEKKSSSIYSKFIDADMQYERLVADKKRLIIGKHMAGNIDNIAHQMNKISSKDKYGIDITLYGLKRALVEFMAMFPVYRTYISVDEFSDADQHYIKEAARKATDSNPGLYYELKFIEKFFLFGLENNISDADRQNWARFVMNFQQFTGPLMAKGFEDTTLYIYNRLISLNEVGGDPGIFGVSEKSFHEFNSKRAARWPHSINATSTHDVKRGEDIRARINVLSEIPKEWEQAVKLWAENNKGKKITVKGRKVPDKNDEYFFYQTLVGSYPEAEDGLDDYIKRVKEYSIKAVREAKVHTAWLKPDNEYESAYISFIESVLKPSTDNQFLKHFLPFQQKVAHYGRLNSLSQTVLKMTTPGIPDFYQGTELWDLNFVDPDNRRSVDYKKRMGLLRDIQKKEKNKVSQLIQELLCAMCDGKVKQYVVYRALRARKELKDLFQKGSYMPLDVEGARKEHIVAFTRRHNDRWVIIIVPRFLVSLVNKGEIPLGNKIWKDTAINLNNMPGQWHNVFTDKAISIKDVLTVGEVLSEFPVAILVSK
ncbi:MAG: malto-oligosyltrehalose synthase [Candidatus Ancaeobacter aquaticus]|nr:malto-oligosyltrehalose synthase [Candidatus Ancaeobacter aquaticus]